MIRSIKSIKPVTFLGFLLVGSFFSLNSLAADSDKDNPLRFYNGPNNSYLQATFKAEFAYFNQSNAWFGNAEANIGEKTDSWWESAIRPGIEGSYFLEHAGEIYGRLDAVQGNTQNIDAANSNEGEDTISDIRVEDAYIGWRSGDLFSSAGQDFLDISFGRQQYVAGNGFLFYNESSNGNRRGAYWIGARKDADFAGIIRMRSGGWSADLFYLESDDDPDTDTRVGGGTLDYKFESLGNIGGGFYNVHSDIESRDSMDVYDIRFSLTPFAAVEGMSALKPLTFEGEYVYEDPDTSVGRGWYLSAGYDFEDIPWKPGLTYRYSSFDENYDPLFYGFYDWGCWYQGEILGEYVLANSNLESHMLKFSFSPIDSITAKIFYYSFDLYDAEAFGVTSDNYADEYDIAIDWAVNENLIFSVVGGYAEPDNGAEQHTGGEDNWAYMMLYGSIRF